MMDKKRFKQNMLLFCENYNFEISESYLKLVFGHLDNNNITDECFENGVNNIITTKKKSDFYGRPAVADWLDMLGKKVPTLETIAHDKASQVFSWLTINVNFWTDWYSGANKERLSENQDYAYEFEEDLQYVVDREFGNTGGLIKAYGEAYLSGFSNLFKKDLIGAFKTQGAMLQSGLVSIEGNKQKTIDNSKVSDVISNLSKQLTEG